MALEHMERRGHRAKRRREELDLTQEDVAERIQEIHRQRKPDESPDKTRGQMVSDWERAVNEPLPHKLELWAAALDWTVGDLNSDPAAETGDLDELVIREGVADQLDRIETKLDQLLDQLDSREAAELVDAAERDADQESRRNGETESREGPQEAGH